MRTKEEVENARANIMIKMLEGRETLQPLELVDLRGRYQALTWVLKKKV